MGKLATYDSNEDVIVLKLAPDSMTSLDNMSAVGSEILELLMQLDHSVYMLSDWTETYLPSDWALMDNLVKVIHQVLESGVIGIIRFGVYEPANKLAIKTHSILCSMHPYVHQTREEALQTLYGLRGQIIMSPNSRSLELISQ